MNYLDKYTLLFETLRDITRFFTENHVALNHLPDWVWDKEKTGIDFEAIQKIIDEGQRYLDEMRSSNIEVRELIKNARNPARRLMVMIRELHDMGYQRIRFYPHIGGAGYWRYIITSSAFPTLSRLDTGSEETDTVWQSLGSGDEPFGWNDQEDDSIRVLAEKFLAKYRRIAAESKGEDQRYAAWYRDVLDKTRPDGIIYFWWDGAYESTGNQLGVLKAGKKKIRIPYPYDYQHLTGKDTPIWL